MNKKKLLIQTIEQLQWSRDLADGILALLETADIDEKTIDLLIKIIAQSIKTVKSQSEKSALEKSLNNLHKIQGMEASQKESDEDIEHILDDIF